MTSKKEYQEKELFSKAVAVSAPRYFHQNQHFTVWQIWLSAKG
jgi:hypothetical protein